MKIIEIPTVKCNCGNIATKQVELTSNLTVNVCEKCFDEIAMMFVNNLCQKNTSVLKSEAKPIILNEQKKLTEFKPILGAQIGRRGVRTIEAVNLALRKRKPCARTGVHGVSYSTYAKKTEKIVVTFETKFSMKTENGIFKDKKIFESYQLRSAIICRLTMEKEHLGENAPQKHLFEEYRIE
jgi:hypothetical protein